MTATYGRGTVAMARTAEPDSVGSQFFIVLDDAAEPALASANTYQIIGEVTAGMDVVDAIAAMPNGGSPSNAAVEPGAHDQGHRRQPVTCPGPPTRRLPMTRADHRHRGRRHRGRPVHRGRAAAAANFIKLANAGFYDDVIFHRVIPGFMIQGGDGEFGKKASLNTGRVGTGGPGYKFEDEPFTGRLPARHPGDGERRPEHQRLPVLHLPRRRSGCPRTTRSSAR